MKNGGNNGKNVSGGNPPSPDSHSSHPIIPPRGDYQTLHSFHKAEVVYDLTFRFAHKHLARGDRTVDQMIQAARSGKKNLLEGSKAALTSKETEIKLTNVGRASLEELLDVHVDWDGCIVNANGANTQHPMPRDGGFSLCAFCASWRQMISRGLRLVSGLGSRISGLGQFRNTMTRVRARTTKIWTAVAERSGDTAFHTAGASQSGVALRFPPQSKIRGCGASRVGFIRVYSWFKSLHPFALG
jgi:hypothetical protein